MPFILKMLVARYGADIARVLYAKYKDEKRKRDNRTAEQYQKGFNKPTGGVSDEGF